jgi:hypothetical protein
MPGKKSRPAARRRIALSSEAMVEGKPDLNLMIRRLYDKAMRLLAELENEELSDKQKRWRYDALAKVMAPLLKLLQIQYRMGELEDEDLAKILSELAEKKLLSLKTLKP